MTGFRVKINGKELAAISNEGLNILTVQLHGDVIGSELAVIEIFGGHYEGDKADNHLIWVSDYEITSDDEVEIAFSESITTSYPGKTIEELYPEAEKIMGPWQPMGELFQDLAKKPKLRQRFFFELIPPSGEAIYSSTSLEDYSFNLIIMWKWLHPDEAKVTLTSNSLEGIEKRTDGNKHAKMPLQFGEMIKLRVGT